MAIGWRRRQREKVGQILQQHPAESSKCHDAARKILPIARELDQGARVLRISPAGHPRARYVVPRLRLPRPWFEHYTTEVTLHYVDVLTGVDGTDVAVYLDLHWEHSDRIKIEVAEP